MNRKDCMRLVFSIIIVLTAAVWVSAASDSGQASNKEVLSNIEQRLRKRLVWISVKRRLMTLLKRWQNRRIST